MNDNLITHFQDSQPLSNHLVRLPQEISDQLLIEMETSILSSLVVEELKERQLSDVFFLCSLLSNLLCESLSSRLVMLFHGFSSIYFTIIYGSGFWFIHLY